MLSITGRCLILITQPFSILSIFAGTAIKTYAQSLLHTGHMTPKVSPAGERQWRELAGTRRWFCLAYG
jgi:hypothetical protein